MSGFLFLIGDKHHQFYEKMININDSGFTRMVGVVSNSITNKVFSAIEWSYSAAQKNYPDIRLNFESNHKVIAVNGYVSEPIVISRMNQQGIFDSGFQDDIFLNLEKTIQQLNGSFSILTYDVLRKNIKIYSDRWASRSFWRYFSNNTWLIASNPAFLWHAIGGGVEIAPEALGGLLMRARPTGDGALLHVGKRNLPGTIHNLEADGSETKERWYNVNYKNITNIDGKEWSCLLESRLIQSANRIRKVCKRPLLFLSGGLDSRLALAALSSSHECSTVTLSHGENLSTKIARLVAARKGVPHLTIFQDNDWYLRGFARSAILQGGCYHTSHSHFSEGLISNILNFDYDGVLLGDFLECFKKLLGFNTLKPEGRIDASYLADNVHLLDGQYSFQSKSLIKDILKPGIYNTVMSAFHEHVLAICKEALETTENLHLAIDYLLRWRAAYEVATYGMIEDVRAVAPERSISMDTQLHDLMLMMPASIRKNSDVVHRTLHSMLPECWFVPNSNSLLPLFLPYKYHKTVRTFRPYIGEFRQKIRHKNKKKDFVVSGSWPNRDILASNNLHWIQFIENILFSADALPDTIFNLENVRTVWNRFKNGDFKLGFLVNSLVVFGIVNKQYGAGQIYGGEN